MKKLAHDTRAATGEIAGTIASLTREAEAVTSEIKTGVEQSRVAQSSFSRINETVRDVADIVALVDRQTDGIAQSTSHIQQSVDSVKSGLSSFAADARANGGQLKDDPGAARPSSKCAPTRCSTGSPPRACASTTRRSSSSPRPPAARSTAIIEAGIDRGEVSARGRVRHRLRRHAGHQSGPVRDPLLRLRRRCMSGRCSTG